MCKSPNDPNCCSSHRSGNLRLRLDTKISNNASYPLSSIVQSGHQQQPFFFQLYVNSERHKTAEILRKARSLGIKAIFVTVDAPVPGKREADERIASETAIQSAVSGAASSNDKKGGGIGRLMAQYIDKSLAWSDLAWIRKESGLPIVLKGVQNVEDAKLAVEYGVDGILLSNHGGRSLDTYVLPHDYETCHPTDINRLVPSQPY